MRHIQGSALTEVLVAMFVVVLMVLGITAVSPMTTRMQTQARQYTYATNVAQTVLERVRTMPFLNITPDGLIGAGVAQTVAFNSPNHFRLNFTSVQTSGGVLNLGAELRNAVGTIEVFNLTTNNNISIGLKTVFVTIQWSEPQTNRLQQVQLATTIASLQ